MTKIDNTEALEALDALHSYMMSAVSWSYDDGTQFTAVCTLFDKIRAALTEAPKVDVEGLCLNADGSFDEKGSCACKFLNDKCIDICAYHSELEKQNKYLNQKIDDLCSKLAKINNENLLLNKKHYPEGWQLVPKEPTEGMINSGTKAGIKARPLPWCPETYKAMLAAAPVYGKDGG